MEKEHKNRISGLLATLLFHALLLLALFFMALRTPLPLPEEEGVEVDLGFSNQGVGLIQPELSGGSLQLANAAQMPVSQANEQVLTQATEDAPAMPEKVQPKPRPVKKKESKPRVEKHPPQENVVKETPVVEPEQPKVNQRALFKGSGDGPQTSGSEGITGQPGDQGKPGGIKNVKRYEGQGGQGNGPSFSLGGRGAVRLAEPRANFREQGDVVVDIWVDRAGAVTKAEVSVRGTTILDTNLRSLAVKAALNSKFTEDQSAATVQKGTITYTFIIGN